MGILDELLTGGQRQKEYGDFVKRYEQGDPSEGYSDQEVLNRYGEVSPGSVRSGGARGTEQALAGRARGIRKDAAGPSRGAWRDAAATGSARTEGPGPSAHRSACAGQLRDMLGGGAAQPQEQASGSSPITDILTSPMAKAVLAGIAAMVVKRVMGQSQAA